MAANEDELGNLHTKVARTLSDMLDGDVIPAEYDEEGQELAPEIKTKPSAAILTVAAKFLKDNNITCTPSKENALGELEEKLKANRAQREARRVKQADLVGADESMTFMAGLPN